LRLVQKRPEVAEKLFQEALLRDPNSADALGAMVLLDLQQNRPSEALRAVHEQLAKSPNNGGFYLLLANLLMNAKDQAGAETAAQKAVDLDANTVDASLLLARLQLLRGSTDQAVASYQQALRKNPGDPRVPFALGALEETRGNWQQAQTLYQQTLQIKPDRHAYTAGNPRRPELPDRQPASQGRIRILRSGHVNPAARTVVAPEKRNAPGRPQQTTCRRRRIGNALCKKSSFALRELPASFLTTNHPTAARFLAAVMPLSPITRLRQIKIRMRHARDRGLAGRCHRSLRSNDYFLSRSCANPSCQPGW
jgi:tetratricopeptide (TPR) repeat protein